MKKSGNLMKMKNHLEDTVQYELRIGDEKIDMNQFLGKEINFKFDGVINCIATGEKIKKSYNQGYSTHVPPRGHQPQVNCVAMQSVHSV